MTVFKRKIYKHLLDWKNNDAGSSALLIEGARRVGKSTIAVEFAQKEYKSFILLDFSKISQDIKNLFEDIFDLNHFFLQLQLQFSTDLHERNSLIIFDEVQLFPLARQAIKTLVADGRYDYLETGSLISIKKNVQNILIPSEEKKITMFPMDYEEFRWALGDTATIPLLQKMFETKSNIDDAVHRKLMRDFRLYMLVGGMPQAVETYIQTNNLSKVDEVKRRILSLYEDDFMKIDQTGRTSRLFDSIPAELNKNTSRYQVSSVLKNERADSILGLISQMENSKTTLVSYNVNDIQAGLSGFNDVRKFKLFTADTGLFVSLLFKDKDFTENTMYQSLLSDKLSTNLGYVYENAVAQMLATKGERLFYHTFLNEKSRHNYEIDFLLSRGKKICPIEVKSSAYLSHASLDVFTKKYSKQIGPKYIIHTKPPKAQGDIFYIPVYLTMFL